MNGTHGSWAAPSDRQLLELRQSFLREGFVKLGRVLEQDHAGELKRSFLQGLGDEPEQSSYGYLRHNVWRTDPAFRELVCCDWIAEILRSLLQIEAVTLFQDNVICKPPGTVQRIEWHQDFAYWPLDSPDGMTLWIALDDATTRNGCLQYLPGTHRLGECCPDDFVAGSGQPRPTGVNRANWQALEHDAVAVPLAAGEAVAHHPLTAHTSHANQTGDFRTGYSLTWISPRVRWAPDHAPHPFNYFLKPIAGDPVAGEMFPCFPQSTGP